MIADAQLKKIYDYYKNRYEKAIAMGINEESKHYKAFKEIEYRLQGVEFSIQVMEALFEVIQANHLEKNVYGAVKMIIEFFSITEELIDENGKINQIPRRVKIKKEDTSTMQVFLNAKAAIGNLKELNYLDSDKKEIFQDVEKYMFDIICWMIFARDTFYKVGCDW